MHFATKTKFPLCHTNYKKPQEKPTIEVIVNKCILNVRYM